MAVSVSALGAIVALVVAIGLILRKVPPVYGMMAGALIGGLVGGADLVQTVTLMIDGAKGITTAVMRILAAGVLAGVLIESGVQIVIDYVQLADQIRDADWVITGEGRMDAQSVHGKTPIGVARVAKQFGKPVIALVGCLRADYPAVYDCGIDAVFPIIRQLDSLEATLQHGRANLQSAAENVARLFLALR